MSWAVPKNGDRICYTEKDGATKKNIQTTVVFFGEGGHLGVTKLMLTCKGLVLGSLLLKKWGGGGGVNFYETDW